MEYDHISNHSSKKYVNRYEFDFLLYEHTKVFVNNINQ